MYYEKYLSDVPLSSGWATDSDFAGSKGCIKGRWDTPHTEGGVVLYNHNGDLVVDGGQESRHVLCVGATGTGKSRLVILPSLLYSLDAANRRSLIVYDVKGELRQMTEERAKKNKYKIVSIDFRNPMTGDNWNPFARANRLYLKGDTMARERAWKLVEDIIDCVFTDGTCTKADPFWRTQSANLFRGLCALLWETNKPITLLSILKLVETIPTDKDEDKYCELIMSVKRMPQTNIAKRALAGIISASNQTRGNILASYRGYLAFLTARDDVLNMVSGDDSVNFRQIGLTPTVVYVSLPDDTAALGALQGILVTQMMQELNECAMSNNGSLPVRTDIYLDELCNIRPAIPSLESALTIARSRGIRYVLAIQSYAQLCGVYETAAETIAANCSSWIAFNVAKDEMFRAKLSSLCGNNHLGRALVTPSQLSLLSYEQAIVIRERCAPYFTQLEDVGKVIKRLNESSHQARA